MVLLGNEPEVLIPPDTASLMVGGSWDQSVKARVSVILYDETGQMVRAYGKAVTITKDPLESEGLAMLQGLEQILVNTRVNSERKFMKFSDCKVLVKAVCTNDVEDLPHWQAAQTVAKCAHM